MITIECIRCGESVKTYAVEKAVAFDREHRETCAPTPTTTETGDES